MASQDFVRVCVVVPDGDLDITLVKSVPIQPPPQDGPKRKDVSVAQFKVIRSTLVDLPAEDERKNNVFRPMLTGGFKETYESNIVLHDHDVDALQVFLFVIHGKPESTYTCNHKVMWHLYSILHQYNISIKKFEPWFADWYEQKGSAILQIPERQLLFPFWRFNHAPGFLQASLRCIYHVPHHITEWNPTNCYNAHMPQRIIQQLNAVRGRLRTILHRELFKPVSNLLSFNCSCSKYELPSGGTKSCDCDWDAISPCKCRAKTMAGYERAFIRTKAYPLEDNWTRKAAEDILEQLDDFGFEPKNLDCCFCGEDYNAIVKETVHTVRTYIDGLCLDCMDASKDKKHRGKELGEDDVYYQHNKLKEWDVGCRVRHGQPTWYYSYMGRKQKD